MFAFILACIGQAPLSFIVISCSLVQLGGLVLHSPGLVPLSLRPFHSILLMKFELLSVNQTAIQIKLMKAWKATHLINYATQMEENEEHK